MAFFEVFGFTFTWKNYNVACAFLNCEKEVNYQWVVSMIAELCNMVGKTPTTIVTDRELTLMKAIDEIFPQPKTHHILCRRHVYKNVEGRAKLKPRNANEGIRFAHECRRVFWSKTEDQYEQNLASFTAAWSNGKVGSALVTYMKNWWLKDNFKVRIVSTWTDRVLYFGTTTTNRYEQNNIL